MKTSNDEDQVIIKSLLKMIHCLSYDDYNNDIDMDFLNKVEVIKQYRQTVMNSENVIFFQICNTMISENKETDNGCSIWKKSRELVWMIIQILIPR